jgi:hypothetical protein
MLVSLETKDSLRLGSESDTLPLTSFVDLNWSVLFRYERGTYSIELTAESNDLGIVGSIMEERVQRID